MDEQSGSSSGSSKIALSTEIVAVGDRTFQVSVPAHPDDVLNAALRDENAGSESNPYWGVIWPAARRFAGFLARQPVRSTHTHVLEVGCGVGLSGLMALSLGHHVTFSDIIPEAVELALNNARRNGYTSADGVVMDWSRPPPARFELILASDVLYERHSHVPLLHALSTLLTPDGEAWIADSGRQTALDFPQTADPEGFRTEILTEHGDVAAEPGAGVFRVLRLKRKVG